MPTDPKRRPVSAGLSGEGVLQITTSLTRAACLAAVESWRLERLLPRLCDADRDRVHAIAERLRAGLSQSGVAVQDHTGQPYVEGLAVEIIATEERDDLASGVHRIVETVKPSVFIAGHLATQGQVILGSGVAAEKRGTDGPRDN